MPHPLVIAYHIVWTIYGYWLPNDVRGSTSRSIRKDLLAELGELHHGRKKVQPLRSELLDFFAKAHPRLAFPVRELVAEELKCVAASFAKRSGRVATPATDAPFFAIMCICSSASTGTVANK